MNELQLSGNTIALTSVEIAQLTGKEHFHVRRDIRIMLDGINQSKSGGVEVSPTYDGVYPSLDIPVEVQLKNDGYSETSYKDKKGESRPMYVLNKHYVMLLLTGYSVNLRNAVLLRLEELESNQQSKELSLEEMTLLVITQQKERILLLEEDSAILEKLVGLEGLITFKKAADLINDPRYGRTRLYKFLVTKKVLTSKHEPYKRFLDQKLFETRIFVLKNEVDVYTLFTTKGVDYVIKMIKRQDSYDANKLTN